jgi:hypothetical protein
MISTDQGSKSGEANFAPGRVSPSSSSIAHVTDEEVTQQNEALSPSFIGRVSDCFALLSYPSTSTQSTKERVAEHLEFVATHLDFILSVGNALERESKRGTRTFCLSLLPEPLAASEYAEFLLEGRVEIGEEISQGNHDSWWAAIKERGTNLFTITKRLQTKEGGWVSQLVTDVERAAPGWMVNTEVTQKGRGNKTTYEVYLRITEREKEISPDISNDFKAKGSDYLRISDQDMVLLRERILAVCGGLILPTSFIRMSRDIYADESLYQGTDCAEFVHKLYDIRCSAFYLGFLGFGFYFSLVTSLTDGLMIDSVAGDLMVVGLITNTLSATFELGRATCDKMKEIFR